MSEHGKVDKPARAHEIDPLKADADPQFVPTSRGIDGVHAERQSALNDARFRMTGGAEGTPPMAGVMAQRQAGATEALRRLNVQRKASGGAGHAEVPKGSGTQLPDGTRKKMEQGLGADLSNVRVHTGGESEQAAKGFGARAFTVDQDVHFGAGEFAPGTQEGDRLLAHELTHTVQAGKSGIQRKADNEGDPAKAGGDQKLEVSEPGDPAEKEADAVADQVAGQLHGAEEGQKAPGGGKDKEKKKDKKKKQGLQGAADAEPGGDKPEDADDASAKAEVQQQQQQAEGGDKKKGGAEAAPPAEQAPPIAAKLEGVGRKIFRAVTPNAPANPAPNAPPAHANPKAAEIADEAKKVKVTATLAEFNAMIQSLSYLVTPESKASVNLRVTKLLAAIARTKAKLAALPNGATMIRDFIDSRMPAADSKPGGDFAPKAAAAKTALLASPTVAKNLQVNAAQSVVNYGICAPEEAASDKTIDDSGGIMKVFDVGQLWGCMDVKYQDGWKMKYQDKAQQKFTELCKSAKQLVVAPPGEENKPPFLGATPSTAFTKQLFGFVGQGKDAAGVASFGDAIKRFALNPGYYPSGAMFVVSAGAADVKDKKNKGEIKIGKPSIFNLLNFDENVYDENDRAYGHLADPNDPSKAGSALELTCQAYPGEIYGSAKFLG